MKWHVLIYGTTWQLEWWFSSFAKINWKFQMSKLTIKQIAKLLKPFAVVVTMTSSEKYVHASKVEKSNN